MKSPEENDSERKRPPDLDMTRLAGGQMPAQDATRMAGGSPAAEPEAVAEKLTQLGPYRLLRRLGGGGMGHIYLAVQPTLGRQVAIKVLPVGALDDPESVSRFQREIQVLGQLSHRHICPVLEAGIQDRTHFYVMEYLRGLDLSRILRTQRFDLRRAATIALQIARALQFAHENGVVHRDVKPQNIMVVRGEKARADKGAASSTAATPMLSGMFSRFFSRKGDAAPAPFLPLTPDAASDPRMPSPEWEDHARLIDFGLAREGGSESAKLTATGAVVGTPSYMAPEQAKGDRRAIDATTDVYSLGATLYEMLTLRSPFDGESVGEVLQKVIHAEPVPVRKLNGLVDRDLETIVQKAMEKEQGRRYRTAGEMADDLERWLAGEPILARRASLAYRVWQRARRNPLAAGAIVAAVALLAAGLWLAFAPGTVEILGNVQSAVVKIDGEVRHGNELLVWPPRTVSVEILQPGYEHFQVDVPVTPRSRVPLLVDLVASSGTLLVESAPPGARVFCDGAELGPCGQRLTVEKGAHEFALRLADHEEDRFSLSLKPGEDRRVARALRHEMGMLTLTSDPPEAGVVLEREGKEPILAASPTTRYPLETGKYRAIATAKNCYRREFEVEILAGKEERRHLTLNSMVIWQHTSTSGHWSWVAGDVTGDRHPDIVMASPSPPRVQALDGRTGHLLWFVPMPPRTTSFANTIDMADLDGDLEPEVFYSYGGEDIVVLSAATGETLRRFPCRGADDTHCWDDLDGDRRADLVSRVPGWGMVALRGEDGAVLWRCELRVDFRQMAARLNGDDARDIYARAEGRCVAVDGATGKILWESATGGNGIVVGDFNADGIDDVLVSSSTGAGVALSGVDGSELWKLADAAPNATGFLGDVEGDGKADIAIPLPTGVRLVDAATGKTKTELHSKRGGGRFVFADVGGDERLELIVNTGTELTAYDSRSVEVLWSYGTPTASFTSTLLADFDGDGRQDIAWQSQNGTVNVIAAVAPPLLWRQGAPHYHAESPDLVGDDRVFMPGTPHRLLRAVDGSVLREEVAPEYVLSALMGPGGRDGIVLEGNGARLVDSTTLETKWEAKGGSRTWTVPQLMDLDGDGVEDVLRGDAWRGPGLVALNGKDGSVLWDRPWVRTTRARALLHRGILWVPCEDGIRALRPQTGEALHLTRTEGSPGSVVACGEDVVFVSGSSRVVRATPDAAGRLKTVWSCSTQAILTRHSPVLQGDMLVANSTNGPVLSIDPATGRIRWRAVLDSGQGGGATLYDLDRDGVLDVSVVCGNGYVRVLRGTDGEVIWSWRILADIGWIPPAWADLNRDGTPELLVTARDGLLYAFSVSQGSRPPAFIPRGNVLDGASARRTSAEEQTRQAIQEARRQAHWDRVVALADDGTSAWAAYHGALASRKLDRPDDVVRFADIARSRGCRRIDLDLLAAAASPRPDRASTLAAAILAAPARQILEVTVEKADAALWREAAELASPKLEEAGKWEAALHALAAFGEWETVAGVAERAKAKGEDHGRVDLALGRAAAHAGRYDAARQCWRAASMAGSTKDDALKELETLERTANDSFRHASALFRVGRIEQGRKVAERALAIRPDRGLWFNDLAYTLATSPDCTPEDARVALAWAEEAVAAHRKSEPGNQSGLALVLDTLAAAHFAAGNIPEAIRVQKEALALPVEPAYLDAMKRALEKYETSFGQ